MPTFCYEMYAWDYKSQAETGSVLKHTETPAHHERALARFLS